MRFLDRAEKKFRKLAIHDLIIYIVAGNALVSLVGFVFTNNTMFRWLYLDPSLVLRGQVWRVFSYVFLSSFGNNNIIFLLLELYFLFMIGRNLEYHFGSFRFTIYYLGSVLLTALAAVALGIPVYSPRYIHLSLFFAFASIVPDFRVLVFFVIPVKIKWMAWVSAAFMAYEFVVTDVWQTRIIILTSLVTYFLFFGRDIYFMFKNNRRAHLTRLEFEKKKAKSKKFRVIRGGAFEGVVDTQAQASFHKCEVCGITEVDSPQTEFRYCSKCTGNHEFCMEHLLTHKHY